MISWSFKKQVLDFHSQRKIYTWRQSLVKENIGDDANVIIDFKAPSIKEIFEPKESFRFLTH